MARLSLWNNKKKNDYKFFDRTISEQFRIGGTGFLVHKYVGPADSGNISSDLTQPNYPTNAASNIQDLLLLENRDRIYDDYVYELRGSYNVQDNDFDLSQFGLFLSSDVLFVEFHINDMIDIMGRKLISGDVLEIPHQKDDTTLSNDPDEQFGPSIPKLYKIDDASRASSGYSPTWYPHIWRVKISPLTDSQEFENILGKHISEFGDGDFGEGNFTDNDGTLADLISTGNTEIEINNAIVEEAERLIPNRNLEHEHLYVDECHEDGKPYMFLSDGAPPNGEPIYHTGDDFPDNPPDGVYVLRTDFNPATLFKREGPAWALKEADFREKWTTPNRLLLQFINNRKKVERHGEMVDSRTAVSKILDPKVRPKTDN